MMYVPGLNIASPGAWAFRIRGVDIVRRCLDIHFASAHEVIKRTCSRATVNNSKKQQLHEHRNARHCLQQRF